MRNDIIFDNGHGEEDVMESVESIKLFSWYWSMNHIKLHIVFTVSDVGIRRIVW